MADVRFGGLAEASFWTPLGRVSFLVSLVYVTCTEMIFVNLYVYYDE